MGRKTWESIGRHLPNRINVVISSNDVEGADLTVAGEPQAVLETIKAKYPGKDIIVIGGMQVYVQYVMLCDRIYSSLVQANYEGDTKFSCRMMCQQAYKLVSSSHLPESDDVPGVLYEIYDKIIQ
jgi:dihydrofolate reductase